MHLLTTTPPADEFAAEMRQFIIDQAEGRTAETVERYVQVADDLSVFLASVDVTPWLGPELAAHLDLQRQRLGTDAFLSSLGLVSLIRVLPEFVSDRWLPSPGSLRRTHRTAVRHLTRFLRQQAMQQGCFRRGDFEAIQKALGHAYSLDYPRDTNRSGKMLTYTVTLDLVEHLVDNLLEQVARGRHETFDQAVAARINPVLETVWRDPENLQDYGW